MKTQDKKLPFQIIRRFIKYDVMPRHRSESARELESRNMFSDNELAIISHLEQAATDLRCANPELIQQAKKILSESLFVSSVFLFKRFLFACVELLLIEATQRQKNPSVYDFLYNDGELWYFHNRSKLPKEVVQEIELYLAHGDPYLSPEEYEEFVEYYSRKRNMVAFVREKIHQMPDYERNDFLYSRNVRHWIAKWHEEYCDAQKHVSMHSFENRVYEVRKEEREKDRKKGIEEELKKKQNGQRS